MCMFQAIILLKITAVNQIEAATVQTHTHIHTVVDTNQTAACFSALTVNQSQYHSVIQSQCKLKLH